MEQDQLIILHYLQNKGFLDAEVEIEVIDLGKNQRKVIIHVKLGDRYYFGNIRFEGNTYFEPDRVREIIEQDIRNDKPYSQDELMAMSKKLKEFYGDEGMIETSVQYVYEYNFDTNRIDILFIINESKVFKVGRIIVRGNNNTETRIILSQCELVPGQVYRSSQLQYTQMRLQSMNYFKTVDVVAVKEPSKTLGMNTETSSSTFKRKVPALPASSLDSAQLRVCTVDWIFPKITSITKGFLHGGTREFLKFVVVESFLA